MTQLTKAEFELMLEAFALHANQAYSLFAAKGSVDATPIAVPIPNDGDWMAAAAALKSANLAVLRPNMQRNQDEYPMEIVLTPRGWLICAAVLARVALGTWAPPVAPKLQAALASAGVIDGEKLHVAGILDVLAEVVA